MPKLFCVSDIHGFYDELIAALDAAGFDENNEEHFIVVCGDTTDRGKKPQEVISYLMSLPRKVLVKGNHESLIMDCLKRGFPYGYDYSNGTFQTVLDLAPNVTELADACSVAYEKIKPFVDKTVDYFETKNYIFVHAFVPLKNLDGLPMYYVKNRKFAIDPDWRNAHASAWEDARWSNPFELAEQGFLPDKTLVFGHWHTSWARNKYQGEPEFIKDGADFSPYFGDGYIGIDACTSHSGKVNVLVLEDEFLT